MNEREEEREERGKDRGVTGGEKGRQCFVGVGGERGRNGEKKGEWRGVG